MAPALVTLNALSNLLVAEKGVVVFVVVFVSGLEVGAILVKYAVLVSIGIVGLSKLKYVLVVVVCVVGVVAVVFIAVDRLDTVVVISVVGFNAVDTEVIEVVVGEYTFVIVALEGLKPIKAVVVFKLDAVVIEAELGFGAVENASMIGFDGVSDEVLEVDLIRVDNIVCVVSKMFGVLLKLNEVVADVTGNLVLTGLDVAEDFERVLVIEFWVQVAEKTGAVAGVIVEGCEENVVFVVERVELVVVVFVVLGGGAVVLEVERVEAVTVVLVVACGAAVVLEVERIEVETGVVVVVGG